MENSKEQEEKQVKYMKKVEHEQNVKAHVEIIRLMD